MKISLHTFIQLFKKDFLMFRREYPSKFFDTCFLFFTNVIVFSYFLPTTMGPEYGPFILIGAIASFGLFDIIGQVGMLIADIEGDRTINFSLCMPISSRMTLIQIALRWAMNSALLTLLLFPIGKLLLMDKFILSDIAYGKLLLMYITINLFFGFFSLWLTSMIKKMSNLSHLFMRVINPLFMFGAYFYTWQTVFNLSPILGYVSLINPLLYVMEGMRSAALGGEGYLPFWTCFFAVWGFILVCGSLGIRHLKRRLDCI